MKRNGKIVLLYPSDAGYSASSVYWTRNFNYFDLGEMFGTSWINRVMDYSWLLSPSLEDSSYASSFGSEGYVYTLDVDKALYIQPCLNLISTAPIDANHQGTEADPYVILE